MPEKNKKDAFASLDSAFDRGGRNLLGVASTLPRIFDLFLNRIEADPNQARKMFDEEKVRELADSIVRVGVIQPITVRRHDDPAKSDFYIIVAGERRYRACQRLGFESIPAIRTEGDPVEISLIENIQREDLTPIEEAQGYQRLLEKHEYTHDDVAKAVGKARATITKVLQLNTLPTDIQDECATTHLVPKSILIELAEIKDTVQQRSLWDRVKNGGLTVKDIRSHKQRDPNKAGDTTKASPIAQAVSVGRTFVRKLERVNAGDIAENREHYEELLRLREQVAVIIDEATAETKNKEG